jgi:tRNA U34 2-thiouridine synthase MnmA/TrmU
MGYFKRKIKQLITWAVREEDIMEKNVPYYNGIASLQNSKQATMASNSIDGHSGGMNFTIYSATGGKVVQLRTYNMHTDQSRSTLYVITDKEDLGYELGQIITVESLSR